MKYVHEGKIHRNAENSHAEALYLENRRNCHQSCEKNFLLFFKKKPRQGNMKVKLRNFLHFYPESFSLHFCRAPVFNKMHSHVFMRVQQHKLTLLPWLSGN